MRLRQLLQLRLLLVTIVPLTLFTACKNIIPQKIEQVTTQPQAHHKEGTASVYVQGIETQDDLIILDLLAINAHDDTIELGDKYDPLTLSGSSGEVYTAPSQEINLQPFSSNNLKIAFQGKVNSDRDLILKINSDRELTTKPQMSVDGITFMPGKRVEFATYQPTQTNLTDAVSHHPNGLTLTVKAIEFYEQQVEVEFEAVNGFREDVNLASGYQDFPFLQDLEGNKYNAILSDKEKLNIPSRQTISGILKFAGRVPASVEQLSLYLNSKGSTNERTTAPKILLTNLPGPGSKLAQAIDQTDADAQEVSLTNSEEASLATKKNLSLQVNHANGSVMRLTGMEIKNDYIETDLTIVNGSTKSIELNSSIYKPMLLRDNLSNIYYLAPPLSNPEVEIQPGDTLKGKFRFLGRIAPKAQKFTLITNDGNQDRSDNLAPYMAISDISLFDNQAESNLTTGSGQSANTETSLPSDRELDLQANHVNGSVVRLQKISFQENNITTDLAITNGSKSEITLNNKNDMRLRDNLGNIYNLATLSQNPDVKISAGQTLKGKFVFLGRIAPQASFLTLVMNDEKYGEEYEISTNPKIKIAAIPVDRNPVKDTGTIEANSNQGKLENTPIATNKTNSSNLKFDRQVNHANGSVMQLKNITFNHDNIVVELSITNGYRSAIKLNGSRGFLLRDNLGNVHYLASIPQNPKVEIQPGQTINGKFVFLGRLSPQATSLTIVTNNKYGDDDDSTTRPKMIINGISPKN